MKVKPEVKINKKFIIKNKNDAIFFYRNQDLFGEEVARQAFKMLLSKVDEKNKYDCVRLANSYDFGIGVKKSYKKAHHWYLKAAKNGDAESQYNLYLMYRDGDGVPKSLTKSIFWLKKAALKGDGPALSDMGYLYYYGIGVSKNVKKAIRFYRAAARKGVPRAIYNLGLCYLEGDGVRVSYKIGRRLLEKSLSLGHYRSAFILAEMYSGTYGPVIPEDYDLMCKYLRLARQNGVTDEWRTSLNKKTQAFTKANGAKTKR